jgi:transcription initiation factor TFIIIB Brf1 subunit/transcription initiation factor TFIIB
MVNKDKTNFGKTKPEAFIERYCSKLNINNELTKLCQFISMKIEKMDVKHLVPDRDFKEISEAVEKVKNYL